MVQNLLNNTNYWLSQKLNTNYECEVLKIVQIPRPSRFDYLLGRGLNEENIEEITELYKNFNTENKIIIRDLKNNLILNLHDIGIGISQIIPIIVACYDPSYGTRLIEQPELHIHPKMQCELGDLFIESIRTVEFEKKQFQRTFFN